MRGTPFALALVIPLLLLGCATPYDSTGITGGYAEKEIRPGLWRVTFAGNGHTTHETVQTYWLYRAAEVTLAQGYEGFEVLSNIRFTENPEGANEPVRLAAGSVPIFIPIYTGSGRPHPAITGDIQLLMRPFDPVPGKVFDAAALKDTLEAHVHGEKCSMGNVCAHAHDYVYQRAAPAEDALTAGTSASAGQDAASGSADKTANDAAPASAEK